ncbi:MAG TPA: TonB family protein [Pyrinomonadaceae bacterium]|nr:TonB family protein [Pyrinomonadaceae bacterium]
MKILPLTLLACLLLAGAAGTQNNPSPAQPQKESAEASSPEVLESTKLSAEVVRLHKAGKYDEALPLAKRALQLREKTLAPGHSLIVDALSNLAELHGARRDYATARDYYQRVLAIYEQQSPPQNRAALGRVLDNAGYFSYMSLHFDSAEKYFQRAVALREELTGAGSLETARAVFNLAEFYRLQGEHEKAEPLYRKSIEVKGTTLGPKNKEVEKALERYSCLYYAMNKKLDKAEKPFSFLRPMPAANDDRPDILNGRALSLPKPPYPREARERRLSGTVIVKVWIDEEGKVVSAEDMCGAHPLLIGAAVRAASAARFTPTIVDGKPMRISGVITYRFIGR